ncbi:MAG: phosphatase PAP2 family protein [Anaerolineae bacterium]|nr:phosphatase PAP2 family protein [Anaerolineae bacterium]
MMADSSNQRMALYRGWALRLYLLVAAIAFVLLALYARGADGFPVDWTITRALQSFNVAWFDSLMRAVSALGYNPQALILYSLIVLLLYRVSWRWEVIVAGGGTLVAYGFNLAVKALVNRPRPPAEGVHVVVNLHDPGFPSGHVLTYVAFYGFLWFVCYTVLRRSWQRMVLLVLFAGLVLLVGPSRIYQGEHWASDVVGGYLLASIALVAIIRVYRWGKGRFFRQ